MISLHDRLPRPLNATFKAGLVLSLVFLGDWLFYEREIGISLGIFLAALAAVSLCAKPGASVPRHRLFATFILAASVLPLVEHINPISVGFGIAGTAVFAAIVSGALKAGIRTVVGTATAIVLIAPFRVFSDMVRALRNSEGVTPRLIRPHLILGWIVPLAFCAVFTLLFASANPLIEHGLQSLSNLFAPSSLLSDVSVMRVLLWMLLIGVAWSFLHVAVRETVPTTAQWTLARSIKPQEDGAVFGTTAILRSLVMFNGLFAIQTGLDLVYLWGGAELPEGMTHAAYAHRGAYPLIATALLAAAFVLAAMHPNGSGERSPVIRGLVLLWIGQNVLLVVSSMLRLELYIAAYALTMLRVAAFIWMALVAIGLALIVVRIVLRQSNQWLMLANGVTLAATLYACAFINFPAFIATYNVDHTTAAKSQLDLVYTLSLGSPAIPAIDRYLEQNLGQADRNSWINARNKMALRHSAGAADWRAWTFRDWRLNQYLANHPPLPPSNPFSTF